MVENHSISMHYKTIISNFGLSNYPDFTYGGDGLTIVQEMYTESVVFYICTTKNLKSNTTFKTFFSTTGNLIRVKDGVADEIVSLNINAPFNSSSNVQQIAYSNSANNKIEYHVRTDTGYIVYDYNTDDVINNITICNYNEFPQDIKDQISDFPYKDRVISYGTSNNELNIIEYIDPEIL